VIRLAVRVRRDDAEIVLAELLELAPAGVEEVQGVGDTVEYAVYGPPGELPRLPDLSAAVGEALVEISTSEIADDWDERWKQFHRPVTIQAPSRSPSDERSIVPALRVRPPWERALEHSDARMKEIVIDPGQAFGTGSHASTRLCIELLLELRADDPRTGALLDIGTGSGVLAIAAAFLGFAPVLGLDHELASVEAARQNAAENDAQVEVRRFDLRTQALPWIDVAPRPPGALVILANLLRPLLGELASSMRAAPTHLIAGGLLSEEVDEIVAAFSARLHLRERARRMRGEWAAVWLTSP
jgi:ribosomal protein L11 methyltransferase